LTVFVDLPKTDKEEIKDGLVEEFDENGQLKSRGNYKNGKRDGLVKEFNEEGKLKFRNYYRNGELFSLRSVLYFFYRCMYDTL